MHYLDELKSKKIIVLGLGISGLSTVRFLVAKNIQCRVVDSRCHPPGSDEIAQHQLTTHFGDLADAQLESAELIIISPGISLATKQVRAAIEAGVEVIGDVELFARLNTKPVFAVTGSNGKSSVVTLAHDVLVNAGRKVALAGNIGTPVLDVLETDVDCFVLELSSFQLDTTTSLQCTASVVLNICEDHMDRYDTIADYSHSKQGIHRHSHMAIYNQDDSATLPQHPNSVSFALSGGDFHVMKVESEPYFAFNQQPLVAASYLKILGKHNQQNALAVMALLSPFDISPDVYIKTFQEFAGLAHRCEVVTKACDVTYINDSKATNVGATIAALTSLTQQKNIILIVGGVGKGADFNPLLPVCERFVKHVICLGEDGPILAELLKGRFVATMQDAVTLAHESAERGDIVLLAPACASLDMYKNFMLRGEDFVAEVKRVTAS